MDTLGSKIKSHKLVGKKFNRLTILNVCKDPKGHSLIALCRCDCGNEKNIFLGNIKRGKTVSCGCRLRETHTEKKVHGMTNTPTHNSWENMHNRCTPGNRQNAGHYASRKVCDRWKDFKNFLEDMGERPDGKTLDRIDNSKGYFPENCRWANKKQQQRNMSSNVPYSFADETLCLGEWAEITGISYMRLWHALKKFNGNMEMVMEKFGVDKTFTNKRTLK